MFLKEICILNKQSYPDPHVYGSIRWNRWEHLVWIFHRRIQIEEQSEVYLMTGIDSFVYAEVFQLFLTNCSV